MPSTPPGRLPHILSLAILVAAACSQPRPSGGSGGSTGSGGGQASGASGGNSSSVGSAETGGNRGTGGAVTTGGSSATGGFAAAGGSTGRGGMAGGGGSPRSGGSTGSGGVSVAGGTVGSGGSLASGGSSGGGGTSGKGGTLGTGGAPGTGGSSAKGGATGSGGASSAGGSTGSGTCSFTVISNSISTKMATVGVVEWSTTLASPTSAQIVYTLDNAASTVLNKGGTAPVDLKKANYRTLLLGLKQSSNYTFHIEATSGGTTCKSSDYTLPKTGALTGVPTVTRTATNAAAQAAGFITTSGGLQGTGAYIIDADGAVVWYSTSPGQCSRARMDYEGVNMWMMALNVQNGGGEMRFVSMDGQTSQTNIAGLEKTHHDFAVLPGKVASMYWASTGTDPESNLVEHASDGSGSTTTVFKIGSNLYAGGTSAFGGGSGTYHCNSILYHPADDSYTIGDRNPNLYVKVKHDGTPVWQIGGSCTSAKAPKCAPGSWTVNHGHDIDATTGDILIFNNGQSGASHVLELKLTESTSAISTASVKDYSPGTTSNVLGDVQRLPNGNTLVTFSTSGQIVEVDPSWATVQTIKSGSSNFGYSEWRPTMYGPPER